MLKPTLATLLLFLIACPPGFAANADAGLTACFQEYLDASFRLRPTMATGLGDHRFDDQLDDLSAAARARWKELARNTLTA